MHLQTPLLNVRSIVTTLLFLVPLAPVQAAETITATARVKSGAGVEASAPVSITVDRFTTEAARTTLLGALKKGGPTAVRDLLLKAERIGSIQVGKTVTPIKYAYARSTGAGRLITALTDKSIVFIGGGLPNAPAKAGFDLGLVFFEVPPSGAGTGELVPAAKIRLGEHDSIVTEDYGGEVVRLSDVVAK